MTVLSRHRRPSGAIFLCPPDPCRPWVWAAGLYQVPVSDDGSFIKMRLEVRPPEPVSLGAEAAAADASHALGSLQPQSSICPGLGHSCQLASSALGWSTSKGARGVGHLRGQGAFPDAATLGATVLLDNSLGTFLHLSVGRFKAALIKVVERGWTCGLSLWSWVSPASHGEGVRLHTAVPRWASDGVGACSDSPISN